MSPDGAGSPAPLRTGTPRFREGAAMKLKLKKLEDQVVVITGGSSGIGLATANMAAQRGAKVVLNSRDATALKQAAEQIRGDGGQAIDVAGDVSDFAAM